MTAVVWNKDLVGALLLPLSALHVNVQSHCKHANSHLLLLTKDVSLN